MAALFEKISSMLQTKVEDVQDGGVLGVDVGSSAIKVVEITPREGTPVLTTYGELQLGPYAGVEIGRKVDLKSAKMTEALIDIVRESSATTKNTSLAVSYNSSFATLIKVPGVDEKDISTRIPVEARKYIPVPLNSVTLDWFSVGADTDGQSTHVLLAAIHNEALKKYQSAITRSGLKLLDTEIEIFSTVRSAMHEDDETVAVIDFGASVTKLYIATKGLVMKTHSIQMGGSMLTDELAKALQIEFSEAEEQKRSGVFTSPAADKVLVSTVERAVHEIQQVIKRTESEQGVSVNKVLLSGAGALLSGLQAYTQSALGRKVELANPFSKLAYPAFLEDTLREVGPSFAAAIGAALHQFYGTQKK